MTSIKPSPCPCCGSEDIYVGLYSGSPVVRCQECDISIGGEESTLTEDEFLSRWNRRVQFTAAQTALHRIIARSHNGELGSSKVIDMPRIAEDALEGK